MPGITLNGFPYSTNPIKFSVYRNAAQNTGNGSLAVVNFDTKTYDTSSNVDIVTNKGRFTAPIAGFYTFKAAINASVAAGYFLCSLFKNGSEAKRGVQQNDNASTFTLGVAVTGDLQLVAGDYVEVYCQGPTAGAITVGAVNNYFDGSLQSIN